MFIPDVYRTEISLVEMYNGLRKVITSVISNRDSWPFREPINEEIAPMYYQIIPHPIDLSVIKRKIEDQLYNDLSEVEEDFKLLVNNCETYNGPRNGYTLLSYAVWRVFKRSVKRFLNVDLNFDEQVAFIYPPKRTNLSTKAAIEARRKRRKHRKLRALDILAKAAEEAVKCTTIRGSRSDGSDGDPSPSSQSPLSYKSSNSEDKVKFFSNISGTQICFSVDSESLSDCDSNSNFPSHLTLNLNIGMDEENLTFKSLSEWSDYIRLNGEPVKLPQQSVILPQTPLERTSGHLHPNEIQLFRSVCLEKLKYKEREQSTSSMSSDDRSGWSDSSDSSSASTSNYLPPQNPEHKPIVIKLSRCNSDNGTIWKPVQIDDHVEQFNNAPDIQVNDSQTISHQTSCPLPIHTKNVHPRSSIGEEGLNFVPKKRLALDDDVFCHSYINEYNTQASSSSSSSSPSSSSSSSSSSSDESNSSQTKKLLNHPNNTNNQHLCLSEDSSMDSSSD